MFKYERNENALLNICVIFLPLYFVISIIASLQEPYQTYIEDGCSSAYCFKGLYADVFHSLKEALNFTFTIKKINLTVTSMEMIGNI